MCGTKLATFEKPYRVTWQSPITEKVYSGMTTTKCELYVTADGMYYYTQAADGEVVNITAEVAHNILNHPSTEREETHDNTRVIADVLAEA